MAMTEAGRQQLPAMPPPHSAVKWGKRRYNDIALQLARRLYGLEYLHYGYFKDLSPTIDQLPQAQEAYVQLLLAAIPDGVADVLDVGCGGGGIARQLLDRGYQVSCVDPDPYMMTTTWETTGGRIGVHHGFYEKIEDLRAASADLVLMSESCQYINPVAGFQQTLHVLRPGGHLLIADFFKIRDLDQPYLSRSGHRLEKFLAHADNAGLELIHQHDITPETAPTMDIYQAILLGKVIPVVDALSAALSRRHPWVHRALRRMFGKKAAQLRLKYHHQDSATFSHYKGYFVLLFRRR
jgi:SAM-dependent methyltransferase